MASRESDVRGVVDRFLASGWESEPFDAVLPLLESDPESLVLLAHEMMARVPRGASFLDAALSFIREQDVPALLSAAVAQLEAQPTNKAAVSVVEVLGRQLPRAVHPHLERLFVMDALFRSGELVALWREAGPGHLPFLRAALRGPRASAGSWPEWSLAANPARRALRALAETRLDAALADVLEWAPNLGDDPAAVLAGIGLELAEGAFRALYPSHPLHLVLPRQVRPSGPPHLLRGDTAPEHPSFHATGVLQVARLGGELERRCGGCGGELHRLLTLQPVPAGLGVTGLDALSLATCLSCLGWTSPVLHFAHDTEGTPRPLAAPGREPELRAEPLAEAAVSVVRSAPRWRWQDWGAANGLENLHRLGGFPCWVQNAEHPPCVGCGRPMGFLLQLDSNLPTASGGEWTWGTGGLMYAFWCDRCRHSAFLWQDT